MAHNKNLAATEGSFSRPGGVEHYTVMISQDAARANEAAFLLDEAICASACEELNSIIAYVDELIGEKR